MQSAAWVRRILLATALAVSTSPYTVRAEDVTLTTYYPAPFGAYDELTSTGDTGLATDADARVGIGTGTPNSKLAIESGEASDGIDINNTRNDGDPRIAFQLSGATIFTAGIDDSDVDRFKIGTTAITNSTRLGLTPAGDSMLQGGDAPNRGVGGHLFLFGGDAPQGTGGNVIISTQAAAGGTAGVVAIGTAGVEYLRMTNAGNVGIRNAVPAAPLDVINQAVVRRTQNSQDAVILRGDDPNIGLELRSGASSGTPYLDFANDGAIDFDARLILLNNDTLMLDGARLGIGINALNTTMLDVNGNIATRGDRTYFLGVDNSRTHWLMAGGNNENTDRALGFQIQQRRIVAGPGWTKNFLINHPLDPAHKYLVYTTLEGPENAVFYRGEGRLDRGRAEVLLTPHFEALARSEGRTVLVTPVFESDDEPVSALAASPVKNGRFAVKAIDERNPSQRFSWEVKAVRSDVDPLETELEKSASSP